MEKDTHHLQRVGGLPSTGQRPALSLGSTQALPQLNLLLGLLHLHPSTVHVPLLVFRTCPSIQMFSLPSRRVPPWHSFVKSLWPLALLCWCWYISPDLPAILYVHRTCFAARLSTLFPVKSCPLWRAEVTGFTHEGPTLVQGHSERVWQESQWVAKGSRRALPHAPQLPVLPIASPLGT